VWNYHYLEEKPKIICLLDLYKEIYEYTKGVIGDRKTKDRLYNSQQKKWYQNKHV